MTDFLRFKLHLPALLLTCVFGAWGAWTRIELPGKEPVRWVRGVENDLYAASDSVLFLSHDEGATWDSSRVRFPYPKLRVLLLDGENLYLSGVFHSHDHGRTWTAPDTAYSKNSISTLIGGHGVLYGGNHTNGAFRSRDSGVTWEPFNASLFRDRYGEILPGLGSFALQDGWLFVSTANGIYRVDTTGTGWARTSKGLPTYQSIFPSQKTYQVLSFGGNLYAVTFEGIYMSEDLGGSWKPSEYGLPAEFSLYGDRRAVPLIGIQNEMYVETDFGLYYSYDSARTWKNLELSTDPQHIQFLAGTERFVFAATDGGELLRRPLKYTTHAAANVRSTALSRVKVDRSPSGWTVAYQSSSAVPIRLELRDGSGRRILSRSMIRQAPGRQTCVLGTGLLPGVYLLVLRNGDRIERMKIRIDR